MQYATPLQRITAYPGAYAPHRPVAQRRVVAFAILRPSRHPEKKHVSGPQSYGPHVRMPSHRRPCFQKRRQACYRLGRAHP